MAEALTTLREKAICVIPYLDDLLVVADNIETMGIHLGLVLDHLQSLGWLINWKKSDLIPSKRKVFLGITLDTVSQRSFLPPQKIVKLQTALRKFKKEKFCSIRQAMKVLGSLSACIPAVAWAQFHLRPLQKFILDKWNRSQLTLERIIFLDTETKKSLTWWLSKSNLENGIFWAQDLPLVITTDASLHGWGAVVQGNSYQGTWGNYVSQQSSNFKELRAVWEALKHTSQLAEGRHVLVYSDNATAVAFIQHQGGTRHRLLQNLANKIFSWAEGNIQSLSAVHLKGVLNIQADYLSRHRLDPGEWMLAPEAFHLITKKWGRPTIDLFASRRNHQLNQFFSLNPRDHPRAVDAFNQSWTTNLVYAFAPFPLIPRVLQKFLKENCPNKGKKAAKSSISRWIKMAISEAYKAQGKDVPASLKAHSTRGMAASWAEKASASLQQICRAATWKRVHTFTKHYRLDVAANDDLRFGRKVLSAVVPP
ncbi:uncharacterized protein LOC121005490 [Bufo bufo]|uniref:uncharacterized protein LOC121005490 n=1 Tax=Bufo bufo TaxID=8384 RepID=UPI001ABE75FB|nr:uncharacterized protein LOC121005490 [Bufo bufo]